MYEVKTKQFEGPLHLLLELIQSQKMDIAKLSLVEVADDFLSYVGRKDKISLANLSEFLVVASQLILIKSKALLPLFELDKKEEEDIADLEGRLKEYQRFKTASLEIEKLLMSDRGCFSKDEDKFQQVKLVIPEIPIEELKNLFQKVLQEVPVDQEMVEEVLEEIVSLEEKISELKVSVEKRMKVAFHETISQASGKVEVVVTFLAMLEMVKQQLISVKQEDLYGEIIMEKQR